VRQGSGMVGYAESLRRRFPPPTIF